MENTFCVTVKSWDVHTRVSSNSFKICADQMFDLSNANTQESFFFLCCSFQNDSASFDQRAMCCEIQQNKTVSFWNMRYGHQRILLFAVSRKPIIVLWSIFCYAAPAAIITTQTHTKTGHKCNWLVRCCCWWNRQWPRDTTAHQTRIINGVFAVHQHGVQHIKRIEEHFISFGPRRAVTRQFFLPEIWIISRLLCIYLPDQTCSEDERVHLGQGLAGSCLWEPHNYTHFSSRIIANNHMLPFGLAVVKVAQNAITTTIIQCNWLLHRLLYIYSPLCLYICGDTSEWVTSNYPHVYCLLFCCSRMCVRRRNWTAERKSQNLMQLK